MAGKDYFPIQKVIFQYWIGFQLIGAQISGKLIWHSEKLHSICWVKT